MPPGLRKEGGARGVPGAYAASGTLAGIDGPGKRTVTSLSLRRLGAGEDLSVLAAFGDLEQLELDHVQDVDLSPLAVPGLRRLAIKHASGVLDLTPVARLPRLELLILGNLHAVHVAPLALAGTLRSLTVINDDPALTGAPVKHVVEAIDWDGLGDLHTLSVGVGGLYEMPPIQLDLSFLRSLPALERLDMHTGIRHAGAGPSPLEPPFHGLSKRLSFVRIDAEDPEPVRRALCAYLGLDPDDPASAAVVYERRAASESQPPWTISELPDGGWAVYGSLWRASGGSDGTTEFDLLREAKRRLRAGDAALLKRLDFDPESAGTGISAASREDLERALDILGLAS
jgi:hypothetical protein